MSSQPNRDHAGPVGWTAVWKINAASLKAVVAGGGAWAFWELATPGLELFAYFAAVFAMAFLQQAVIALAGVVRLILRGRAWARYRRQGAAPKADRMAGDAELRRRGLLK